MQNNVLTLEVPDVIFNSYRQDVHAIKQEIQRAMVIWEYLNGHLSLVECGQILGIGYRGFLELLWSKGIAVDGLDAEQLDLQVESIRHAIDDTIQ